jgi:hypothetical protein
VEEEKEKRLESLFEADLEKQQQQQEGEGGEKVRRLTASTTMNSDT